MANRQIPAPRPVEGGRLQSEEWRARDPRSGTLAPPDQTGVFELMSRLIRIEALSGKRVKGAERARLIAARIAWQSGNLAGLYDAVRWCGQHRQPLPDDVCAGVLEALKVCLKEVSEGTGQHARWAARYEQDQQDLACWESLRRARAEGLKGNKALEAAAIELAGRGIHLEPGGIQKASDRVKQARRTASRPGRYYSAAP